MLTFGMDEFMSECRALTNVCGNTVASIFVSKREGKRDAARARKTPEQPRGQTRDLREPDDKIAEEPALA